MKSYPTISHLIQNGLTIYAFNKIDGSNIRAEWSKKKGLHKFGTRTRLLGTDQEILYKSKQLIIEQEEIISEICNKEKFTDITLFFEFSGNKSKFGVHEEDDEYKIHLIDVSLKKYGFLLPKDFVDIFYNKIPSAQLLYKGNCNSSFILSVKDGTLEGIGSEGVVCKAKGRGKDIIRFKIKRESWYQDLRNYCKENNKDFEKLK